MHESEAVSGDIQQQGERIVKRSFNADFVQANKGKLVLIEVVSGATQLTSDDEAAENLSSFASQHPNGQILMLRLGEPFTASFGASLETQGHVKRNRKRSA